MREAPAIAIIEGLLAVGANGRCVRSGSRADGAAIFDGRIALCEQELRRAEGRRRAGDRDRVERVPGARFREDAPADARAGRLRRPEHLLARAHARARLHLFLHWPLKRGAVLVTGGAGYIGSHAAKALSQAGYRVVVFGNLRRATGGAAGVPLVDGRYQRRRTRCVLRLRRLGLRGDALRRVPRRGRVGARTGAVLPQQRRRRAGRARGDGGGVGGRTSCFRRRAPPTASRSRRRSSGHIRWEAGPRLRRDEAGHRAGAAALRARLRPALDWRCATSTPPAPF